MFLKQILEKKSPKLVLYIGSAGKSMAVNMAQHLFTQLGIKNCYSFDDTRLVNLLSKQTKLSYLFKESLPDFPEYVFFEVHHKTKINPDLLQYFSDITVIIPFISSQDEERYKSVKEYLLSCLPILENHTKEMNCIYSHDIDGIEEIVKSFSFKSRMSVSTGGNGADIYLHDGEYLLKYENEESDDARISGIAGKLVYNGSTIPFHLRNVIGTPHINSLFLGLALLQQTKFNLIDAIHAADSCSPLPGRMKIVPGIKKTTLIDDSYNSSLESAILSVSETARVNLEEGKKRYCILSDIMDLESQTESGHCFVGEYIAKNSFNVAVFVGERSRDAARCAIDSGLGAEFVHHFEDKNRAGREVQNLMRQGDLVLIKGDQTAQFETVVKELMAFPLQAGKELLKR